MSNCSLDHGRIHGSITDTLSLTHTLVLVDISGAPDRARRRGTKAAERCSGARRGPRTTASTAGGGAAPDSAWCLRSMRNLLQFV